jgi:hypothetical protein
MHCIACKEKNLIPCGKGEKICACVKGRCCVGLGRCCTENQLRSWAPWSLILNFFEIEILKFQKNPKKIPDVGNNVLYGLAKS